MFQLKSAYQPAGDQPKAIAELLKNLDEDKKRQVLLGVTGSGKTFTVANVIQKIQKPTLVIAHNKTLAAQLYQEFRDFFPDNAVSYFVSYYDYYQPEAYIASSDTYIEKEATINDEIDKLRLGATANLLSRPDSIVIASVSCIYGLGKPEDFSNHSLELLSGAILPRKTLFTRLTDMQYIRTTSDLLRGTFRVRGDRVQIWPANVGWAVNLNMPGDIIQAIEFIDPTTGSLWQGSIGDENWNRDNKQYVRIYPTKHYMTAQNETAEILKEIEHDLHVRLAELRAEQKIVEAYRLEQRTLHDIDMIREVGFVNGIENYSRYFDRRKPGEPPYTLLDYFHYNAKKFGDGTFLTVIDESHITIPQISGMYFGDRSRKENLVAYGFRLPASVDNRPLTAMEFEERTNTTIYVSATPSERELKLADNTIVEQIVRPTGLIDPPVEIRPVPGQIPNLVHEILIRKQRGQRTLVTTLTKRMAETLADYLNDQKKTQKLLTEHGYNDVIDLKAFPKVQYLHSDIDTIERSEILDQLRNGEYDVLIGVNLLREGLDLPEVTLVAILDADQEGFLRSTSSLIQTMGRAARHVEGQVILYADRITDSMKAALDEVDRRRTIQMAYNEEHGISPTTISKPIRAQLITRKENHEIPGVHDAPSAMRQKTLQKLGKDSGTPRKGTLISLNKKENIMLEDIDPESLTPQDAQRLVGRLTRVMNQAAKDWNFELATKIRDTIARIEG